MKQPILVVFLWILCLSSSCVSTITPTVAQPSVEDIKLTIETLMETPQPLPAFVLNIEPAPGETVASSDTIFVAIYQGALWEPWNLALDLQAHIVKNTFITIDYKQIPAKVLDGITGPGRDANGELTNRFFSPVEVKFTPDMKYNIEEGPHLATIRTTSMSEVAYEYSWVFIVSD